MAKKSNFAEVISRRKQRVKSVELVVARICVTRSNIGAQSDTRREPVLPKRIAGVRGNQPGAYTPAPEIAELKNELGIVVDCTSVTEKLRAYRLPDFTARSGVKPRRFAIESEVEHAQSALPQELHRALAAHSPKRSLAGWAVIEITQIRFDWFNRNGVKRPLAGFDCRA